MGTTQQDDATRDLYRKESEQLIIGILLIHEDILPLVQSHLPKSEMFGTYLLSEIYKAMLKFAEEKRSYDVTLLCQANPILHAYDLGFLVANVPVGIGVSSPNGQANIISHLQEIKEAYFRREIYSKMQNNADLTEILQTISELERRGEDRFLTPKEISTQVLQAIESGPISGLKYPFPILNKATGGIHKGQYIIVAARPGAGKTTFLENLAYALACQGKKVLYASAEMPAVEIAKRSVTHMAGVNIILGKEQYSQEEMVRIQHAARKLEYLPIFVHEFQDTGQLEFVIKDRARDFDIVIVDYVQLLQSRYKKHRNDYERVSAVSLELVGLARKYKIPFVCAVQLGRDAQNQQPTLADIKNSGQIEQDADLVISLWEHKEDQKDSRRQKVRMDILKNRNGYTMGNYQDRQCFLWCDRALFMFSDPTTEDVARW